MDENNLGKYLVYNTFCIFMLIFSPGLPRYFGHRWRRQLFFATWKFLCSLCKNRSITNKAYYMNVSLCVNLYFIIYLMAMCKKKNTVSLFIINEFFKNYSFKTKVILLYWLKTFSFSKYYLWNISYPNSSFCLFLIVTCNANYEHICFTNIFLIFV